MSFDQSRSDKSDAQYRKSGRSAAPHQQRTSSYGKGGGGGGPPAPSSSASLTSNRSFKKSSHGQGGQYRVNSPALSISESAAAAPHRNLQNGAHQVHSHSSHATSDAPVSFGTTTKPLETTTTQKVTRTVPKAPTSQPASLSSDTASSLPPPANNTGDASKFAFQFGSLGPVALNGMQIPARTNSAPPNLDEQKRDQARHETFKSVPPVPIPTPKQPLPRKEPTTLEQSNASDAHTVPKSRRDIQASTAPLVSQTQKSSVITVPMTSMQMPFHQPPVSVQFGGPNPQIQAQGVPPTSLQVPVPMAALPMGNAPQVQQPMFVQGLQPHPMQPQGIMHQGQGLNFTPQMGPQLPPQLGNMGIGVTSRYPQQQGGKFGGPRKTTVKITDPNTHEELRLDKRTDTYTDGGSSGLRSHPNVPSQSQPIPSFPPTHHMNYYPNSYNPNNLFFQPSSSVPLTSGQIPPNSQQPRYNYSISQGPQNVSFVNPSAVNPKPINFSGPSMHGVTDHSNLDHARDVYNVISSTSSGAVQVKVKPAATSIGEKNVDSHSANNSSAIEKVATIKASRPSMETNSTNLLKDSENVPESSSQHSKVVSESTGSKSFLTLSRQSEVVPGDSGAFISSTQSEESVLAGSNAETKRKETLSRSNSIKDHQKKPGKKGYVQSHKIGGQPTTVSGFSSLTVEQGTSSVSGDASLGTKTTLLSSANSEGLTQSVQESVASICPPTSDMLDDPGEHTIGVTSDSKDVAHQAKLDDTSLQDNFKYETQGAEDKTDKGSHGVSKLDDNISVISLEPVTSESGDLLSLRESESAINEIPALVAMNEGLNGSFTRDTDHNRIVDSVDVSTCINLDSLEVGKSQSDETMVSDTSSSYLDNDGDKDVCTVKSSALDQQVAPVPTSDLPVAASTEENIENSGDGIVSLAVSSSKEKAAELTRSKSTAAKPKKKRKEFLQKADAAGITSDLYMAYKGPEEKKETAVSTETENISISSDQMQEPAGMAQLDSMTSEKGIQNKAEPDDWEDAADMSTPKLETSDTVEQGLEGLQLHGKDGSTNTVKKYSRDFLLKFSELCSDLPERFEITADIADALMNVGASHVDREPYPSPGRVVDRSNSGSRMDRRGSGMTDDDRWSKLPSAFGIGRDLRLDIGFGGNTGFRPGQVVNYGVLRNPRAQTPVQFAGGILTGPMQSMGSQAVMQRNSSDADRWQRAPSFQQKGLIPSPQSLLQMMHKAERKYEVGKVTDEEEAKQRQLKAILNKLTPQNFEKLFEQVKEVNIDNVDTLNGVISQIFDKALTEPTFCEMYANFCYHLAGELPDFIENNEKITFKRLLLNKCQEEFEKGEREQEEANKAEEEGETKQSAEEREEKRTKARRRMLGNIRLIGELYKKKMLTERIMHECIKKLLGQYQNPDEEDVEALCKLMSTIGEMIDHSKAKEHMDAYFDRMAKLSNNMKLSSRVRFMLKDAIDLRKNKWQQRRKVEGPKKIDEVHRDAAQERHHQTSRLSRNPSINPSPRRAPMDFAPRGSAMLSSSNPQMGGFHGLTAQVRGYGTQDIRFEERQSYEARTFSVPLPRPLGDDSITLGPQGGLARGMSFRGPPAMAGAPLADVPPSSGDPNRMGAGLNGISMVSERSAYSPREEFFPRYTDRFAVPATFDESIAHERNINYVNRDPRNQDRSLDRSHATSPPGRAQAPAFSQISTAEKVWPEERLRDMSMAAIREFYSARDEKEVVLCIKELNALSFHPSMISLWVTDSFERKDMERDLLAKLLVNLARSHDDRILSPPQLIKGFESVLTTLEDAVNDAPRAAEFLGRMLAKAVLENVVALREFGQLLREGGEEPRRLLEIGLAGDVLGSTLETIRAEKGENVLSEICMSSNLHLEDFRPTPPNRSRTLEKFI